MTIPFDEHEAARDANNERTRARLADYATEHSRVWIGKINIFPPARAELVAYTGQLVHTFTSDFAVPKPDPTLLRLIIERAEAPYPSTTDDGPRLDAIFARLAELGGLILTWR